MAQVTYHVGNRAGARCQVSQPLVSGFQLSPQLDYRVREGWKWCLLILTQTLCVQVTCGHTPTLRARVRARRGRVRPPPAGLTHLSAARWGAECPSRGLPHPFPPSLAGKLRASISLLIALIRDRRGVNWKTLVLCLFGEENVNKN